MVGLLTGGHILLEGVQGLAKTLAVRTLAEIIQASFSRIQFTPDLLPADVVGTMVFDVKTQEFGVKKGPIFANILLADEINRAPAKVQSALLEAMQERQVTIGGHSYRLEEPFLVLATQNPIESEGTYPLPEAQLDRFLLKLHVGYPTRSDEKDILLRMSGGVGIRVEPRLTPAYLLEAMSEGQASIEGITYRLPAPFLVIATQNPIEFHGTYPLREAQLDRFAMRPGVSRPQTPDILVGSSDRP